MSPSPDKSQPLDAPQPTIPLPRGPVPQAPPAKARWKRAWLLAPLALLLALLVLWLA